MLTASSLNASTEEGSSGASPPEGEAMVIWVWGARTSYGCANSGCVVVSMGRDEGRSRCTKYHPVGLPVSPILEWLVRTKRTFG